MKLAIFDLDNTLLAGDSDYLWGEFLAEQGVVDGNSYKKANDEFYEQYKAGELDIFEFLEFALKPLSEHDLDYLAQLHREYMQRKILPLISQAALDLVKKHKDQGHLPLIITATNLFVTAPIATAFGVEIIIATEPELINNRYTGKVKGTPCFQHGKVERLQQWMDNNGYSLEDSWFYSDSHNDLPLLQLVTHPIAVDPDDTLHQHATRAGWEIISLHNNP